MLQNHNKKIRASSDSSKPKISVNLHTLLSLLGNEDTEFEGHGYDLDEYPDAGDDGEVNLDESSSYSILEHVSGKKQLLPGDIRKVLAANKTKTNLGRNKLRKPPDEDEPPPDSIVINGRTYVAKMHKVLYKLENHTYATTCSLMDRGANGGLAGADVRLLERSLRTVDVTGIDNHQVNDLSIVTCAGKVCSDQGFIILIMHQYAYYGQGKTIHSCCQLEQYKIDVCDKSRKAHGGKANLIIKIRILLNVAMATSRLSPTTL